MNHRFVPVSASFSPLTRAARTAIVIALAGAVSAQAFLPPGATPAAACSGSGTFSFPKTLTACGPTFGAWDVAYAYPFYGRAGFYVNATVNGTDTSQNAYIELDQSGNTIRRIAPGQTDTAVLPTEDSAIFFASQHAANSTELSFGRFLATGNYAPVYQYKMTGVAANASVTPFSADGRVLVTSASGNQVDLTCINPNGSTAWARRLTSTSFSTSLPSDTISFASFPAPDGALYVEVIKVAFNLATFSLTTDILLIRLSATGTVEWSKKYAGLSGTGSVIPTESGSLYLALVEISQSGPSYSITKLTSAGTTVWSKKFGGVTLFPVSEVPGGKLLLSGFTSSGQVPYGASVLAVLGTNGSIEAQTQFSIGTYNLTTPVVEGSRIWLATLTPSSGLNPYLSPSPVYVGLTDPTLSTIQWRKYARNTTYALVSPDPETDDVLCSFSNLSEHSVEMLTMKDNLAVNASCDLLQTTTPINQTTPSITSTDGNVTATDFTVTSTTFTPTLGTASLTFETQTVSETSLCAGSTPNLTPPTVAGAPGNFTATVGATVTLTASTAAANPTWQWKFNNVAISGANSAALTLSNIQKNQAGQYTVVLTSGGQTAETSVTVTVNDATGVSFTTHPVSQTVAPGAAAIFTAAVNNPGGATLSYQWLLNGTPVSGATSATLTVPSATSSAVGLYTLAVTANGTTTTSNPAALALSISDRVVGTGSLLATGINHPNGGKYDQFLLTGNAASFTTANGAVTRVSYIDLTDDIVQVEFSGPGVLTITLASASGPAVPVKYSQAVDYMRGHATITITGATENTHFGCYTVGRLTAFDPTGTFNFLQPASASNNPANNGSSLFSGQAATVYDGVADIALLNISSPTNRFGGIRVSNTEFSGSSGNVGIYAPGVRSAGPVNLHNVSANGTAIPCLLTGTIDAFNANPAGRIGITGGDMFQPNGKAIQLGDATTVGMLAGVSSNNVAQPAKTNLGVYERNGVNVTSSVVQNP